MSRAEFHGTIARDAGAAPAWTAFTDGAASANVTAARVQMAAGWHWRDETRGICARREPLFWDRGRSRFVPWRRDQAEALIAQLRSGTLIGATDELILIWQGDEVILRSSASGGSVVYWTEVAGGWAFAQAIPLLEAARSAALDELGLAEISRFGGSYTSQTLLHGISRIPFAHELAFGSTLGVLRPYHEFDFEPRIHHDDVAIKAVQERLADLTQQLGSPRHVLFSGGVDSSLIAALSKQESGSTRGVNLKLRSDDPETAVADRIARHIGLDVISAELRAGVPELVNTIASYASPTLDFSILPTHMVGALARADGAHTLVDGTGGDAWFGFGALANDRVWRHVHHAHALRPAAARAYGALAMITDSRAWTPLKVVARAPAQQDAALAHLCASPLYDVIWNLPRPVWQNAERNVASTLDGLLGGRVQQPWQRMVVADGAFIASGAFAAKSGQWSMVREQATIYPFLTPGLVELARQLPRELLVRKGVAKPVLKELAVRVGIARSDIYRRKAGFQPPLARLVRETPVRAFVEASLSHEHELDRLMTAQARKLISTTLAGDDRVSIHLLYPFWNLLSLRIWLSELRNGAAARQWCR